MFNTFTSTSSNEQLNNNSTKSHHQQKERNASSESSCCTHTEAHPAPGGVTIYFYVYLPFKRATGTSYKVRFFLFFFFFGFVRNGICSEKAAKKVKMLWLEMAHTHEWNDAAAAKNWVLKIN